MERYRDERRRQGRRTEGGSGTGGSASGRHHATSARGIARPHAVPDRGSRPRKRRQEGRTLGAAWCDLDLTGGKLRVERSLEQTKAGLRFKAPKTKHGRRTITLAPTTIEILQDHRRRQLEQRLALGHGKQAADDLVFPNADGDVRSPRSITKDWSMTMQRLGIRATFHALRHTHASELIRGGVDVLSISRRLGHGSPSITLNVYGHLIRPDDRAAQIIEAALSE